MNDRSQKDATSIEGHQSNPQITKTSAPPAKPLPSLAQTQEHKPSLLQQFYNLPISHKQVIALITCQLLSIVGLGLGAILIITQGWRSQLRDQATSEVAVTESNYDVKVNQIGSGFRGQSDNIAIIEATRAYQSSKTLKPDLREQVRQILKNEVNARQIEYATLVGKDLRIIANANTNREGEVFNPNNLVSEVLTNPKQIKTSAIVSWAELSRENPPIPAKWLLPDGFANQDVLIRYTVTPVQEPNTKITIGALVTGDIVNGKFPIVKGTLKTFKGGYSAVYLQKPSGKFALATALDQGNASDLNEAKLNVALSDTSLLTAAAAARGQVVTKRMAIGNRTYTMAAKGINNKITEDVSEPVPASNQQSVAILVRGTPETALSSLLTESLLQELVILLLALIVTGIWAILLRKAIIKPIKQLEQVTKEFTLGDRQVRAEVFAADEVGQLAVSFNEMADNIVTSEAALAEQAHQQEAEAKRLQLLAEITLSIRQSLNLEEIFQTTVKEVRTAFHTDRVVIYRFDSDWQGAIVAESVGAGWTQALGEIIDDPCFREHQIKAYEQGRVRATSNIYQAGLTDCHIKTLERFEVKASLVAPIVKERQLLGLLIAHHCSVPRVWQQPEIDLFAQLAVQVGFALDQANLLKQVEKAHQEAEVVSSQQRQQKEVLQHQLVKLLDDVEQASSGDLTVRAEVSVGEIGTVADFFNAIIESLRQIVTNVKTAAAQVNVSIGENEGAIRQLADRAFQQTEEITRTLDSVEQMTSSIQSVADNARLAAEVARTASNTAAAGGTAMDLTVQNILGLQETVTETAEKVKRLGESSKAISEVVSTINQIAIQTNLLAIKASIEAARAGEEGRGFAVVAEEVAQLATRSTTATKEIVQIVENIQMGTSEVVRAMELGTQQVVEGTDLVKDARASLGQILDVSRQIDQLVQSISNATVSQAQTSQSVTNLMNEIAQVSAHTANSSRLVSSSLAQTVEVARQLQESVGVFKIEAQD